MNYFALFFLSVLFPIIFFRSFSVEKWSFDVKYFINIIPPTYNILKRNSSKMSTSAVIFSAVLYFLYLRECFQIISLGQVRSGQVCYLLLFTSIMTRSPSSVVRRPPVPEGATSESRMASPISTRSEKSSPSLCPCSGLAESDCW